MKKFLSLILIGFVLSGCTLFRTHKQDIEQGNIITEENVRQLHRGMTEDQVENIMGHPILMNIFSPNRMVYIFTFQAGYGEMTQKRVICTFVNNHLSDFQTYIPKTPAAKKTEDLATANARTKNSDLADLFRNGYGQLQHGFQQMKNIL